MVFVLVQKSIKSIVLLCLTAITSSILKKIVTVQRTNACFRHMDYMYSIRIRGSIAGKTVDPNKPFPSCFELHYESEAKCKVFVIKISFHSNVNKTNFHMKSFALSLASIMRFTATRKWSVL